MNYDSTAKAGALARSRHLRALCATTALVSGLLTGASAFAQSTGSQVVEQVVVTANARRPSLDGLATAINAPKDQSIVSAEYLTHEVGSNNFAQSINLLPGVSYSTEDPTGILSSDFRMHGFDGAHVSITVDGTPVNDTGNYAMYPGEYLVMEAVDHITVNMGQTEVDSPTASALGGTVNVIAKKPPVEAGGMVDAQVGSYNFERVYAELDTGAVGPTGVRSWVSFNDLDSNKYKGAGELKRWGVDGAVYQPLSGSDFISVGFTWASDRPDFYDSASLAQINQYGYHFDYNTQWVAPTAIDGKVDKVASGSGVAFAAGNDSNYYLLHPNPVDFGDIRGQSRFAIGKFGTLTVDPYFFYTIANGGGAQVIKENDPRLVGTSPKTCSGGGSGIDLNGDGDCLDQVLAYSPSNTQTYRTGVNSSFIYNIDDNQKIQIAYTFDNGRHRQTGEYEAIDQQTGTIGNVFGARPGLGSPILTADGGILRKRDRFSIAQLNQVAVDYMGKFMDDRLHVTLGVRDPHFERDLHDFCYTYNGSNYWCGNINPSLVSAALAADNASPGKPGAEAVNLTNLLQPYSSSSGSAVNIKYNAAGQANFRMPFKQTYHYTKVLPNAGVSYDLSETQQVYATFSEGFSAPKTDDLYVSQPETVHPETSNNYGVGWRYRVPALTLSSNLWATTWQNHIVTTVDPTDPTLSVDRNVGAVNLYGLDVEAGWKVTEAFTLYTSATFEKSQLQNNYAVAVASGPDAGLTAPLPVKGKELVMTPDQEYSMRGQYTLGAFVFGLEGKYVGKRYVTDTNDTAIGAKLIANADIQYTLPKRFGPKTVLQLNVSNLFDEKYLSRPSGTQSNANPVTLANGDVISGNTIYYYTGAPVTAYLELKAKF